MLLLLALACGGCDRRDPPQSVVFDTHVAQQVGGKFTDEPDISLDPKVAFDVEARCPKIERVEVVQANDTMRDVTVYGQNLATIRRVAAVLGNGKLANARFEMRGEGLYFPLACEKCEVYFGISAPPPVPVPPREPIPGVPPPGGAGAEASQGAPSASGGVGPAAGDAANGVMEGAGAANVAAGGTTAAGTATAPDGVASTSTGTNPGAPGAAPSATASTSAGSPPTAAGTPAAAASAAPGGAPPAPAVRRVAACLGPGYSIKFEGGKVMK